jgi:YD repeat-containing protein
MKMRILSGIAFLSLFLFSCQKEKSLEDGSAPGSTLLRVVTKVSDTDSTITSYGYDGSRRYLSQNVNGDDYLFNGNNVRLTRNDQGVIQKMEVTEQPSGDNVVYNVNYDASNKTYTSKTSTFTSSGTTYKDSTAYIYNTSGKIIEEVYFLSDGSSGGYVEVEKFEYNYDGTGSLILVKDSYYDETTGDYVAVSEVGFEYDSKVNPINLGAEAILVNELIANSAHNVTKVTINNILDPTYNETIDFDYTYNAIDKPVSASVTFSSIGIPVPVYYYYN